MKKQIYALVLFALLLAACARVTPISSSDNVYPTQEVYQWPTEEPQIDEFDQQVLLTRELDAESAQWQEMATEKFSYTFTSNVTGDFDHVVESRCDLRKIFSGVIPTAVTKCRGTDTTARVYFDELLDQVTYNYQSPIFDEFISMKDLRVFFDGASNWRSYAVLPLVFGTEGKGLGLISCEVSYDASYLIKSVTYLHLDIDGQLTSLYVPSFGILEYKGDLYRLPDSCIDPSALRTSLADRSTWHELSADRVTFADLQTKYGAFVPATLYQVFPGDNMILLGINEQVAVYQDIFVSRPHFYLVSWTDEKDSPVVVMERGDDEYFDFEDLSGTSYQPSLETPFSGTLLLDTAKEGNATRVCFSDRSVPFGLDKMLDVHSLENQKDTFTLRDYCFGGTLLTASNGQYLWWMDSLYSDVYIDGQHKTKKVTGYFHLEGEPGTSGYIEITSKPRDLVRDAKAVAYAKEINGLSFEDAFWGPNRACYWLMGGSWIDVPGLSAEEVEDICHAKLSFSNRYDADSIAGDDFRQVWRSTLGFGDPKKITLGFTYAKGDVSIELVANQSCVVNEYSDSPSYGLLLRVTAPDSNSENSSMATTDVCVVPNTYIWVLPSWIDEYETPASSVGLSAQTLIWQVVAP